MLLFDGLKRAYEAAADSDSDEEDDDEDDDGEDSLDGDVLESDEDDIDESSAMYLESLESKVRYGHTCPLGGGAEGVFNPYFNS